MNKERENAARQKAGSPLEWATAALGGVLVLTTLAFLALGALRSGDDSPDVVVDQLEIRQVERGYLVSFVARNLGDKTAAGVVVEGTLTRDGEEMERAETTLDYIPEHSHHEGGLFFSSDPSNADLNLRALGYSVP